MSEYKNHNLFAMQGEDISDMEVCQNLKLNPELAGTPEINEAAISKMQKENYQGFMKQGFPEAKARSLANEKANVVRRQVKELTQSK